MRLIDAEELFNKVGKIVPRNTIHYKAIGEFMNMITNSPTVELGYGKWIEDRVHYVCSKCHTRYSDEIVYTPDEWGLPNYCPNCGAKMRG